MEKEMNLNDYLLLQEAIYTTALERDDMDPQEVHDGIMKKLRGEE